LFKAFDLTEVS